jgi:hypothetical protein
MKTILDNLFCEHLEKGGYILACDMGNFPKARKHPNFIDIGNRETSAGNIACGLMNSNKDVIVYDVAGFVLERNIHSLKMRPREKGKLIVVSYGCGFAYSFAGEGHYPFIDLQIASALDFRCYTPISKDSFTDKMQNNNFIRVYDYLPRYYDTTFYDICHMYSSGPIAHHLDTLGYQVRYVEEFQENYRLVLDQNLCYGLGCSYGNNAVGELDEVLNHYFSKERVDKWVYPKLAS